MPGNRLHVVWRPEDAGEVFERAATFHAAACPHILLSTGKEFGCDNPNPAHYIHTSMALRAEWVNTRGNETPYYDGVPR